MQRTVSGSNGIAAVVGSIITILVVLNGLHPGLVPFLSDLQQNQDAIIEWVTGLVAAATVLYTAASSPPPWLRAIFFWKKPLPPGPTPDGR
jgi:hypothetical protein